MDMHTPRSRVMEESLAEESLALGSCKEDLAFFCWASMAEGECPGIQTHACFQRLALHVSHGLYQQLAISEVHGLPAGGTTHGVTGQEEPDPAGYAERLGD